MSQTYVGDGHLSTTDSGITGIRADIEQLKGGVRRIEISGTVLGAQIAGLVADMKEVKRTSNQWLFALVGTYILKESYDR
ncbi:hypothetical protein HOY80DRAFT_1029965 [Tuber brumale]|nr:hypothetical protein HOY80DRAFT_1029965 [Tuber brumale]